MDGSSSISGKHFNQYKAFLSNLIKGFVLGDDAARVGKFSCEHNILDESFITVATTLLTPFQILALGTYYVI